MSLESEAFERAATINEAFWRAGRARREMAFFARRASRAGRTVAERIDADPDMLREAILAEREACAALVRKMNPEASFDQAAQAIEEQSMPGDARDWLTRVAEDCL